MSNEASDRRSEFEAELAQVRRKGGTAESEKTWMNVGLGVGVLGVAVALVAYILSTGQSDSRDVTSSVILGVFGLSLAVIGSAVFLRYSTGRFLRFWMLRMLYEQHTDD